MLVFTGFAMLAGLIYLSNTLEERSKKNFFKHKNFEAAKEYIDTISHSDKITPLELLIRVIEMYDVFPDKYIANTLFSLIIKKQCYASCFPIIQKIKFIYNEQHRSNLSATQTYAKILSILSQNNNIYKHIDIYFEFNNIFKLKLNDEIITIYYTEILGNYTNFNRQPDIIEKNISILSTLAETDNRNIIRACLSSLLKFYKFKNSKETFFLIKKICYENPTYNLMDFYAKALSINALQFNNPKLYLATVNFIYDIINKDNSTTIIEIYCLLANKLAPFLSKNDIAILLENVRQAAQNNQSNHNIQFYLTSILACYIKVCDTEELIYLYGELIDIYEQYVRVKNDSEFIHMLSDALACIATRTPSTAYYVIEKLNYLKDHYYSENLERYLNLAVYKKYNINMTAIFQNGSLHKTKIQSTDALMEPIKDLLPETEIGINTDHFPAPTDPLNNNHFSSNTSDNILVKLKLIANELEDNDLKNEINLITETISLINQYNSKYNQEAEKYANDLYAMLIKYDEIENSKTTNKLAIATMQNIHNMTKELGIMFMQMLESIKEQNYLQLNSKVTALRSEFKLKGWVK